MEDQLLRKVTEYFRDEIFKNHLKNIVKTHQHLDSYKINPILLRYLSNMVSNDYSAEGLTKALYYPRVLGTSITTTFGNGVQKMFVKLNLAQGSLIDGMDIEYEDKIDKKNKWCQLKSGPNTINSKDVNPMLKEFDKFFALARTNHALEGISINDAVVGILYGDLSQLSGHYQKINEKFPVIIGQDFWHRLTGYENFYPRLVVELDTMIRSIENQDVFLSGFENLKAEIEGSNIIT